MAHKVVNKMIVDAFESSAFSTYAVWVSHFLDECQKGAEPWCKDPKERDNLMGSAVAVTNTVCRTFAVGNG
jgi:hypothetical protein